MLLAPLTIAVPLLASAVLAGAGKHIPRQVPTYVALAMSALVAVSCAWLAWPGHASVEFMGGWGVRDGISVGIPLVVDPIGASFGAVAAMLMTAALVFTLGRFEEVHALFDALMLLFLAALVAFGLTGDLFDLFVFFELMSAAAYALCAYKSDEVGPLQGALNFAVTNTVGAVLVVLGLALVYGRTGGLAFAQVQREILAQHDTLVVVAFWLIACGFLVKAAVFPFHFWLGDAHAVAPTPVSVMFSGVMVTGGVYAVARVYFAAFQPALAIDTTVVRAILLTVGVATALVGAVMCWGQRHLKRLLAFSTVAHVGVTTLGLATLSPRGVGGAAVYAVGHGFDKGALFLLAGTLLHSQRSVDEIDLRGRGDRRTGIVWACAAVGLAGLPPFGTFSGEEVIGHAARELGAGWIALVTSFVSVLTAAAVMRAGARVFLGWGPAAPEVPGSRKIDEDRETKGPRDVPWSMTASAVALVALALAAGMPRLRAAALAAASRFCDPAAYAVSVMDGARGGLAVPSLAPEPVELLRASFVVVLAAALAAASLFRAALPAEGRKSWRKAVRLVVGLPQRAHTGHVGDYVTWLVLGAAAITGAATLAAR